MTLRALQAKDIPTLKVISDKTAHPYPDLTQDPMIEAVMVIADDGDNAIAAVAAKRIVEIYLWMGEMPVPAKMRVLRIMHGAMPGMLAARGYKEAEAFLPPTLEKLFGKRLIKSFGWIRNWPSFCKIL